MIRVVCPTDSALPVMAPDEAAAALLPSRPAAVVAQAAIDSLLNTPGMLSDMYMIQQV